MNSQLIYNPILLIFLSYTAGVFVVEFLKKVGAFDRLTTSNYLGDEWTNRIGVLLFGWLIRHSFMGLFNKKLTYSGRPNKAKFTQLIDDMNDAEVGHMVAYILLLFWNIAFVFMDVGWWYIILFFFINLVFNFYLVLLQQYNKRRIRKVLK